MFNYLLNGPAHFTVTHHLPNGTTLLVIITAFFAEVVVTYGIVLLTCKAIWNARPASSLLLRHIGIGTHDMSQVFLELVFPSDTSKSAFATEQLHILLGKHSSSPNRWHHIAAYKQLHSLELCSTSTGGIRYIMVVSPSEVAYITHSLQAYLPGIKITKVADYLEGLAASHIAVIELSQLADFALPLQGHTALTEHDVMAYLTGHMTKLAAGDLIGYQIITTPVSTYTHHRVTRHMRDLQRQIAAGREVTGQLTSQRSRRASYAWLLWYPLQWFVSTMLKLISGVFDLLKALCAKEHPRPAFLGSNRHKLTGDNPYAGELNESIKGKLDQPLFEVAIRVLVAADDPELIRHRLEALAATFHPFSTNFQMIGPHMTTLLASEKQLYSYYRARSLTPHFPDQQTIISSSELASFYHFPDTNLTKTEGLVTSRSPELPLPLSQKVSHAFDVVIGSNSYGGETAPIGLTLEQRQKHTYIIGKTGSGKTTLLTSCIYQDMVNGKGLAVLDAHGDMVQELLSIVPAQRLRDVVVFDPSDRDWPLGLNLLDPGLDFTSEDAKQEWITSSVIQVFKKLATELQWGDRMEHILRSTTLTALQTPSPSLFTLQRLLTDKQYQRRVAATLTDPVLKQFWQKEFALLGSMQLSSIIAPLTHRLGHFMTTKLSRHILLQQSSSLRIADIMNEGKILLVNLSKGDMGADQSAFFGTILTSFIWMAAYQRTKVPETLRRDFFVYVDEFQNFATPQFSEITSEGRKFHVSLIVSHQNIAQIADTSILKIVAGNAGTIISLQASPNDEAFILPYMKPAVSKGDVTNLAPYHFFLKPTGGDSEDAFSGQTVPLNIVGSPEMKAAVLAYSRRQYGTPKAEVEAYMERLFALPKHRNKQTDAEPTDTKPKDSSL